MPRVQFANPSVLPAPVGNYSQLAVDTATGLIFVAGQVGIDSLTGSLPTSAGEQCLWAIRHAIRAVVSAGGRADRILRLTGYLVSRDDIPAYRIARDSAFAELGVANPPPQMLLVVSTLGSAEYLVEVDAIGARELGD